VNIPDYPAGFRGSFESGRSAGVIPAKAGIYACKMRRPYMGLPWVPASAGTTLLRGRHTSCGGNIGAIGLEYLVQVPLAKVAGLAPSAYCLMASEKHERAGLALWQDMRQRVRERR
jgi:hypothetical protein